VSIPTGRNCDLQQQLKKERKSPLFWRFDTGTLRRKRCIASASGGLEQMRKLRLTVRKEQDKEQVVLLLVISVIPAMRENKGIEQLLDKLAEFFKVKKEGKTEFDGEGIKRGA
jgi:hypothetical protein